MKQLKIGEEVIVKGWDLLVNTEKYVLIFVINRYFQVVTDKSVDIKPNIPIRHGKVTARPKN